MTHKILFCLSLLMVCFSQGFSQSATVAGGGDVFTPGTGGLSASIGQIDYQFASNPNGESLSAGVQQPVIEPDPITRSSSFKGQSISIKVAPNPTTDFSYITVEELDINTLHFTVCDMAGRELRTLKLEKNNRLSFEDFPAGIYLLKITSDASKCLNLFKIIKE